MPIEQRRERWRKLSSRGSSAPSLLLRPYAAASGAIERLAWLVTPPTTMVTGTEPPGLIDSGTSTTFPGVASFIGPYNRFDARVQAVQALFDMPSFRCYRAAGHGVRLAEQRRELARQQ